MSFGLNKAKLYAVSKQEKQEFMRAIWDLAASLVQRAKEKGFDIMLLIGIVVGLVWYIRDTETEWKAEKRELRTMMAEVAKELRECNVARETLAVKVASQGERIVALERSLKSKR